MQVMREEMMAMKGAFEGKLRLAREEAEKLSQRHREEMLRMQESGGLLSASGSAARLPGF